MRFEPVERSAFRTLGLAACASQREVFDAATSVRLALKVGVRKKFDSDLAWLGPVARGESDVRDAAGRLTEPAQRAFERLFWFHTPANLTRVATKDERVPTLEGLERAVSSILSADSADAHTALHDAALVALAGAIRLDPTLAHGAAWARAFELWRRVCDDDGFWSLLVAADLKGEYEQLVTYAEVRELRQRAPRLVSSVPAEFARDAALRTDARECGRALALLRGASLPRPLLEEYEREALGPLEDSVTESLDLAFAWLPFATQPGRDPSTVRNYSNAAWRRFRLVAWQLSGFAAAAGASHYAARRVLEHAASKLLQLSDGFDAALRREESLFVALKARALAPPESEALSAAESKLRALGFAEELREKSEDEYADELARELSDEREPARLFKDDPKGEKTLDSLFKSEQKRAGAFLPALALWFTVAAGCFGLQFCGVIKTRPARTYPGGFPMPTYTPFQMNYNMNLNYNLGLRAYPIPTPLTLEEPRTRRRSGRRARTRGVANDSTTPTLPTPASTPAAPPRK